MPTFIDESGDTGWKPGSLPFFRLAAVWLPSQQVVETFRESIRALRPKLKVAQGYEFKFVNTHGHAARRQAFFQTALEHEFRFAVCAYDKNRIEPGSVDKAEFHWGCSVTLASCLRAIYLQAEGAKGMSGGKPAPLNELVIVDDNRDEKFLAAVKRAFRGLESARRPAGKLVGKVKFRGSEPDDLLQLVDMIVGSAGAHLDGDSTWWKQIEERSVGLVRVP